MTYKRKTKAELSAARRANVMLRWERTTQEERDNICSELNRRRAEKRAALKQFQRNLANT